MKSVIKVLGIGIFICFLIFVKPSFATITYTYNSVTVCNNNICTDSIGGSYALDSDGIWKPGQISWIKGKTKETCSQLKSISENMKINNPMKKSEVIAKSLKSNYIKPNRKEQILIQLINQNNFPFRYVGNGEFILGGKCPDFLNCNGQKKLIELFGDYWHRGQNPQNRIDMFSQYGFKTLIIWEHELKQLELVIEKIRKFNDEI